MNSDSEDKFAEILRGVDDRTVCTKLTVETLREIDDDDVEQVIIDYVDSKISGDYDRAHEIVRKLSPGLRAVYATFWVEAEVNNGGFNQYFWNTRGRFADEAVAAFRLFGAEQHERLMREAIEVRAAEAEKMQELQAQGTLEAFSESYKHSKLDPLDDRFYKLGEDLHALRVALVRRHPELFVGG